LNNLHLHPSLQLAWALANREAFYSSSSSIDPLHFLVALLLIVDDCFHREAETMGTPKSIVAEIINIAVEARNLIGLPHEQITSIRRELGRKLRNTEAIHETRVLHRSEESRILFHEATRIALSSGAETLTICHLLEALLDQAPDAGFGERGDRFKTMLQQIQRPTRTKSDPLRERHRKIHHDSITNFGRDITALAAKGRLTPFIGRKKEITTLARCLHRTTKRNALLIGEAGVGKTAIVEGLAQKIANREVPEFLQSLRIVQINVSDLIAGTQYRGDMEQRLKKVIDEATLDPNLILFLDEIHLTIKAGSGNGIPLDIAGILKPALSREDFRCIGATTVEEYERYIKSDSAFSRRFQIIRIPEPSSQEALQICQEWARRIEQFQDIKITENAVLAAVELSAEFIRDRSLPDKAIDLLENAAVIVKISSLANPSSAPTKFPPTIDRNHILNALEEQTGIAVQREKVFDSSEVELFLRDRIVGQDQAISEVVQEFALLRSGCNRTVGPATVILFMGPTGVGKTFMAECLGEVLFPNAPRSVIRFNLNEFKERHEISKLIGAPPGFIGHDQAGSMFRFTETNPRGLIILDEFDKAHPEIQDYFLQIFDKGEAQDSRGRKVDFRQYIFILTLNTTMPVHSVRRIGFAGPIQPTKHDGKSQLAERFRPEFLARIRLFIEFRHFRIEDYQTLLNLELLKFSSQLVEKPQSNIELSDLAICQFVEFCLSQAEGYRGFRKLFDRLIQIPFLEKSRRPNTTFTMQITEFRNDSPIFVLKEL